MAFFYTQTVIRQIIWKHTKFTSLVTPLTMFITITTLEVVIFLTQVGFGWNHHWLLLPILVILEKSMTFLSKTTLQIILIPQVLVFGEDTTSLSMEMK